MSNRAKRLQMLIINEQAHQLEPIAGKPHWFKASTSDGNITAVWMLDREITDEQMDLLSTTVKNYQDAFSNYGAAIPQVLSWGCSKNGFAYVQTLWTEGPSLAQLYDESVPGETELMRIAEQTSRVVMICHKLNLVHGHLKAGDIRLDARLNRYTVQHFEFLLPGSVPNSAMRSDLIAMGSIFLQLKPAAAWLQEACLRCLSNDPSQYQHAGDFYLTVLKSNKANLDTSPLKPVRSSRSLTGSRLKGLPKIKSTSVLQSTKRPLQIILPIAMAIASLFFLMPSAPKKVRPPQEETAGVNKEVSVDNRLSVPSPAYDLNPAPAVVRNTTPIKKIAAQSPSTPKKVPAPVDTVQQKTNTEADVAANTYLVKYIAHFHNRPDPTTRRHAFINKWNNAKLHPLDEQNDFIYIVYTNDEGQTSKGWLSKKDLIAVR